MSTAWDLAQVFAILAHDLGEEPGVEATTAKIVHLARQSVDCDLAAVWHLAHGEVRLDAATDLRAASRISQVLAATRQGPAWASLREHAVVRLEDLTSDRRWPRYRDLMLAGASPLRAVVAYPLQVADRDIGALVLYSRSPSFFTDELVSLGSLFACHAAIALDSAQSLSGKDHLQVALATNRTIGMALGILMSEYKITQEAAFDLLRAASQNLHRKLHDIADEVVTTGVLPEWVRRPAS
jgi:transcriptional regulator with GAF, ATPase, and Fis domain